MDKIVNYSDYFFSLKTGKLDELFQSSIVFDENNNKLIIRYPADLDKNDGFFFFITNYAQRYFQEKLRIIFNLDFKAVSLEKFVLNKDKINYRNKPFISVVEQNINGVYEREYTILY